MNQTYLEFRNFYLAIKSFTPPARKRFAAIPRIFQCLRVREMRKEMNVSLILTDIYSEGFFPSLF